jgi:1,4-dihydroxy-6-naphthoate synthase
MTCVIAPVVVSALLTVIVRLMPATNGQTFTIGHSPDPDDAFMFYAIAAEKIDLRGYRFRHQLEDIQTLNERATRGELHISAVSIHAYAYVTDKYALLPCGASMGDGYGPLVVSANEVQYDDPREFLSDKTIAVPGTMTSASLALQLYLGESISFACTRTDDDAGGHRPPLQDGSVRYIVVPFDEIFEAVKNGRADAGLIIHEGQLTYARSGFHKIIDLGEWWKNKTGLPLPLGGNVLRKDIPSQTQRDLTAIMRESIDFGLTHRDEAVQHSMPYARDMDSALASKFIGMYVNDYTRDYGDGGREAIRRFLGDARAAGYLKRDFAVEFVR